ncbi:MAG: uracil-DNA glycosylase [Firmicutes bacterium]|nr:uracil-DNA glycosylase [Bacillota bacterium]
MLDMLHYPDIESLTEANYKCTACSLRAGCKQVVVARGTPGARVMLVGEGPGGDEDRLGEPFVGKAGQLLDKILAAAELPPEDVYITNVVKCRPPNNRLPKPDEVKSCLPWLERQLELVDPEILVCLGALAGRTLIDPKLRITKDRGQWRQLGRAAIIATFHPAYLLRDPRQKRPVWIDFQNIRDRYRELRKE